MRSFCLRSEGLSLCEVTARFNVPLFSATTCRTLAITRITPEDEAIYQCIAENSAGTNQASARLAISQGSELPEAPTGLQAAALSSSSLQLTWDQPAEHVSQQIIGYVLHIRKLGGERGVGLVFLSLRSSV